MTLQLDSLKLQQYKRMLSMVKSSEISVAEPPCIVLLLHFLNQSKLYVQISMMMRCKQLEKIQNIMSWKIKFKSSKEIYCKSCNRQNRKKMPKETQQKIKKRRMEMKRNKMLKLKNKRFKRCRRFRKLINKVILQTRNPKKKWSRSQWYHYQILISLVKKKKMHKRNQQMFKSLKILRIQLGNLIPL